MSPEELKKIPAVDKLLTQNRIIELSIQFGSELVVYSIRQILQKIREDVLKGRKTPKMEKIIEKIELLILSINGSSLKSVINATGIVLHTNLARAPLGENVISDLKPVLTGYSNLEYDLEKGRRGFRNSHISKLLSYITGAESSVVVNNNAAGIMLCLKTFAEKKEVIISRGELIEIGGSFRIPDIIKASGAKMKEVGTTNRTKLSDYEDAITDKTRVILKAHKSNYFIGGFTEEVEIKKLVELTQKHNLIFIYDMGSGLLRKPKGLPLQKEPDVKTTIQSGIDIVTFSGDKLLGGPQAGIIAGKNKYISKISKAPMMRALRVGKLTIAVLTRILRYYMRDCDLLSKVPIFMMLNRNKIDLENLSYKMKSEFEKYEIPCEIIQSTAFCGGGTLPQLKINSYAVKLLNPDDDKHFPKKIFRRLLQLEKPIIGILREGNLMFDVLSLFEDEFEQIAISIKQLMQK